MARKFILTIAGDRYEAEQIGDENNLVFNIYHGGKPICLLGMNENGKWESNCGTDEDLVNQIGQLICHQYFNL